MMTIMNLPLSNVPVDEALSMLGQYMPEPMQDVFESASTEFGHYDVVEPDVTLLTDGRFARLKTPMTYFRADGSKWPVPTGTVVDGASIPRLFWSLIGGPFEGKYRNASIIHDHYCVTKSRPWRDTHRMFYEAMRCSDVERTKANIMFYAVYRFGPRWSIDEQESLGAAIDAPTEAPSAEAIQAFLADAEAITRHNLDVNEIAMLAEIRSVPTADVPESEPSEDSSSTRAELLVIAGGSATAADIAAVSSEARMLPAYVVDHFFRNQIRIIACRGSVTDFEADLRDQIPRGWERTGRTWDSVPGSYFDDRRRVVIATVEKDGLRAVPDKSTGLHGSDNLVVHEALHGYDYSNAHTYLADPEFLAARATDIAGLKPYEAQAGQAGLEETFAETGAQHCVADDVLFQRCPNLAEYWQCMPVALGETREAASATDPQPLGTATRMPDGHISFDLRAESEGGGIGHASFTIAPGTAEHDALAGELFGDEQESGGSAVQKQKLFFG